MELILASSSPRRKEIMSFFSLPVRQISPDFDESQVLFEGDPAAFAQEVAKRKAMCLAEKFPNQPILAADTVVFQGGRIFLKPETMEEARVMLSELSGKIHQVYTGVAVAEYREELTNRELDKEAPEIFGPEQGSVFSNMTRCEDKQSEAQPMPSKTDLSIARGINGQLFTDVAETTVEFHELTQDQIQTYHRNFGPLDKAGAYAIQKGGSLIVKRIEGCYYNIMGLPLQPVYRLLLKVGINLWDYLKPL